MADPRTQPGGVELDRQRIEEAALAGGRGFVPLFGWTEIEVTGKDRATILHNFSTNDIKRLLPGQGCEAFILNGKGNTLGHVHVFAGEDRLTLSGTPGQGALLAAHLERYVIREDAKIVDRTSERGVMLLAGGAWEAVVKQELGVVAPPAMYGFIAGEWQGVPVMLGRTPLVHPAAWLLSMPAAEIERMRSILVAADGIECSDEAFTAARIAAGFPWFGRDISDKNLPQEVARDPLAISFKKGCYLGQETVARIDALGHVNKVLCGLRLAGEGVLAAGSELRAGGTACGTITSSAWSARHGHPLALAYLRRERSAPATKLESDAGEAEVVRPPLE